MKAKDIETVHSVIVSEFPEETSEGIKSPGQLSFLEDTLNEELFIEFGSLFEKSAYLCCFLAQSHIFVDGNKRTALCATALLLRKNGYKIEYSSSLVSLLVEIARANDIDTAKYGQELQKYTTQTKNRKKDKKVKELATDEVTQGWSVYKELATR